MSKEDKKKIYDICKNYFDLSLKCDLNEEMSKAFKDPKKTVAFLTDGKMDNKYVWEEKEGPWKGCGMKLPKNTRVILDYEVSWPTLYFEEEKGDSKETIIIKESPLMVQSSTNTPDKYSPEELQRINVKTFIKPDSEITIVLPFDETELKNYDAVLVMPCFIPDKDMLTKVCLKDQKDQPDIILTSC
ncbi:hypothetical protein [Aquimarina algiphila]|uniref:Uncharacterized protein n=1 Tax=Aquimarina algiphila TaxID=2047982 RepID=A0A554VCW3_9FLAO|nr:hypothetical protein [Aquimarina algiphila]TSE04656.1 hypothetical protein FOF46_25560 [Aquimarina algiphila]